MILNFPFEKENKRRKSTAKDLKVEDAEVLGEGKKKKKRVNANNLQRYELKLLFPEKRKKGRGKAS